MLRDLILGTDIARAVFPPTQIHLIGGGGAAEIANVIIAAVVEVVVGRMIVRSVIQSEMIWPHIPISRNETRIKHKQSRMPKVKGISFGMASNGYPDSRSQLSSTCDRST